MRFLLESLEDECLFPPGGEALPIELPVGCEVTQRQAPDAALQGQVSF